MKHIRQHPVLLLILAYGLFWSAFFTIEGGMIHQGILTLTRIQHYHINGIWPAIAGITGLIICTGFLRFRKWGRKGMLIFFGLNILCTLSYLLATHTIDEQKFLIEFMDLSISMAFSAYLLNNHVKKLFA